MADKYIDHGLYGSSFPATPTWNTPQDGDGTGTGSATCATVSVDMTGWTFSTSSTVSVMGSTAVTCTASATSSAASATPNAQYNATLTTMIDNLVTAINFHSGNTANIPAGWAVHQVRDTIWARRSGNSLQLMTRAGSASWNALNALAFTNVTGSSSQTWTGGVGGAWGAVFNETATAFPSAKAVGAYGAWVQAGVLAGVVVAGDVLICRSNKALVPLTAGARTVTLVSAGTANNPVTIKFDAGVVWPGDGTDKRFIVSWVPGGSYDLLFSNNGTNPVNIVFDGCYNSLGQRIFRAVLTAPISTSPGLVFAGGGLHLYRVDLERVGASVSATPLGFRPSGTASVTYYSKKNLAVDCYFKTNYISPLIQGASNYNFNIEHHNCIFECTHTSAHAGVCFLTNFSSIFRLFLKGCKFVGFVAGSRLFTAGSPTSSQATIEDCDFGNVTKFDSNLYTAATTTHEFAKRVAIFSTKGNNVFYLENSQGYVEWNPMRLFPTRSALLLSGNPWVWRVGVPITVGNVTFNSYFELPPIVKNNTLGLDNYAITLAFAINSSLTVAGWNTKDLTFQVRYWDENDIRRVETLDGSNPVGNAFAADTATWSYESGGQVIYDDGAGVQYYDKYKLTYTTAYPVRADSNVIVVPIIRNIVADASQFMFIDPDFTMVAA